MILKQDLREDPEKAAETRAVRRGRSSDIPLILELGHISRTAPLDRSPARPLPDLSGFALLPSPFCDLHCTSEWEEDSYPCCHQPRPSIGTVTRYFKISLEEGRLCSWVISPSLLYSLPSSPPPFLLPLPFPFRPPPSFLTIYL